ncbi:hypothetical protein BGZ47_005407 [Haplosporangium gracile]|nr:hypothetical protein BGZ47_005407 [Haplosporangium gracile]
MKFITITAMLLAPTTLVAAAPTLAEEYDPNHDDAASCLHSASPFLSSQTNPEHPSIAASLRKGQLYVKLSKAMNLTDKALFGKSDSFLELWLEMSYKQRFKQAKGLNLVFNQTFCFYVHPGQGKLYVKAADRDPLINDKIGDTSISLSNVFVNGKEGLKNSNLQKWLGLSSNGRINMEMQFAEDYGQK